jgi:uncharacterized membrane protein HdeD (DUF308 family)
MSNIGILNLQDRFRAGIDEISHRWGWYFALGVLLSVLGVVLSSYAYYATVASVMVFGAFLVFGGITLCILSFLTGKWSGFLLSLAIGVLSIITGVELTRAPVAGAAIMTLVIASYLFVSGIFRMISAASMRFPNWGWAEFSGIVSVILGALLWAGWPATGLWFIGFYLGIDLFIHGLSWCMFALSLRSFGREFGERREIERPAA